MFGNQILGGVGHFNIIAEDPVVADFEPLDAGALAFLFFNGGDEFLAAAHIMLQYIEILAVAWFDHAAFPDGERGFVHNGAFHEIADIAQCVNGVEDPADFAGFQGANRIFNSRQGFSCIGQRTDFAGIGGAIDNAGNEAFDVADAAKRLNDFVAQYRVTA